MAVSVTTAPCREVDALAPADDDQRLPGGNHAQEDGQAQDVGGLSDGDIEVAAVAVGQQAAEQEQDNRQRDSSQRGEIEMRLIRAPCVFRNSRTGNQTEYARHSQRQHDDRGIQKGLPPGLDFGEGDDVAEQARMMRADDRPADGARAAAERGAADHHRRDRRQGERVANLRVARPGEQRDSDAGAQRGHEAGDDIGAELDRAHRHAGLDTRHRAAPDREQIAPVARLAHAIPAEHDQRDDEERQGQPQRARIPVERGECRGHAAARAGQDQQRQPARRESWWRRW